MYAEGSSLSAVGRVLGCSAPAAPGWVKKGGVDCLQPAPATERGAGEGSAAGVGGVLR